MKMIKQQVFLLLVLTTSVTAYISIVTGANGFVGRHVVHSLLRRSDGNSNGNDGAEPSNNDPPSEETIVCLVRPDKVAYEEAYWNALLLDMHQQQQSSTSENHESVCVKVMPYDMLDNGKTLSDALETAIKNKNGSSSSTSSRPICVYHIASVFGPTPDPIQTARDNVQSAEDVVKTLDEIYQRHPNSKPPRLVLTSSMAAVRASDQTPLNGEYYTHKDWNTLSKLNAENWGSCYQWSKAESEKRAWELVKECNAKYEKGRQIEMVALCPSFVFGPPPPMPSKLTGDDNANNKNNGGSSSFSLTLINQWLRGESQVQSRLCADVRDVAQAHVAAGTMSMSPGSTDDDDADDRLRYILSTEERLSSELTAEALIRGVERAQKKNGGSDADVVDTSKITCDVQFTGGAIKIGDKEVEASERLKRDLGVVCRPVEETMRDMAEALLFGEAF